MNSNPTAFEVLIQICPFTYAFDREPLARKAEDERLEEAIEIEVGVADLEDAGGHRRARAQQLRRPRRRFTAARLPPSLSVDNERLTPIPTVAVFQVVTSSVRLVWSRETPCKMG